MKTRSTTVLIILAVIATASLIGYYYAYIYVESLGDKKAQATADLELLEAKYTQALSLQAVANSGKDEGVKLDRYIVNTGEEIAIVKNLEGLASNLTLLFVAEEIESQPSEKLSSQGKDLLHIVVSTRGTFSQTRKYLSLLETFPYNVKLNKVELTEVDGTTPGTKVWQARFDISIVKEKDITIDS